jgi:hypothetical protein
MEGKLVLPEAIEVTLVSLSKKVSQNDTLCFCLHLFAKNKIVNQIDYKWGGYDYIIKPIFSKGNILYLPNEFIKAYEYSMPSMEYRGLENCFSFIEITMMSVNEIQQEIDYVENNGFSGSMSNLYSMTEKEYKKTLNNAKNGEFITDIHRIRIRDIWDSNIIKLYNLPLLS